jgi:heme oxygenase (staphylobilin-producing)
MNRLSAPAEFGGRIEQGFAHANMKGIAGFINFKLLKLQEENEAGQVLYIATTTWEDKAAFEAWRQSDNFARAHGGQGGNSPLRSTVETFEVVQNQ